MAKKKPISVKITAATFAAVFSESDKGCILLASSLLDRALEELHETVVSTNLAKTDAPSNFFNHALIKNRGPLSDSYGKNCLAFAYGLIDRKLFDALETVRKLRNEAAHCMFEFTFDDPGVVTHLRQLEHFDDRHSRKMHEAIAESLFRRFKPEGKKGMAKFDFVIRCLIFHSLLNWERQCRSGGGFQYEQVPNGH